MTWDEFRDRLRVSLRSLTDRCCVVVVASDERGCVQFFGTVDVLSAEASGPEVVGGAAVHGPDDPTMLAAGWKQSTRAQPNWSFDLPLPAMTSEYAVLAGPLHDCAAGRLPSRRSRGAGLPRVAGARRAACRRDLVAGAVRSTRSGRGSAADARDGAAAQSA